MPTQVANKEEHKPLILMQFVEAAEIFFDIETYQEIAFEKGSVLLHAALQRYYEEYLFPHLTAEASDG